MSEFEQLADESWVMVLEPIDPTDLERLKRLWALPYAGDLPFEFREVDG